MSFSIVAADAMVLKHRVISIHNSDSVLIVPDHFNKKSLLLTWTQLWSKIDIEDKMYRQVYNIRHSLVGNKIVDHSDVVGASPVGAAPTTSSFST